MTMHFKPHKYILKKGYRALSVSFLCLALLGGSCLFQDQVDLVSPALAGERLNARALSRLVKKSPEHLYKIDMGHVEKMFQAPSLVRYDAAATMMQFASNDCVIDMYFLTDDNESSRTGSPALTVQYFEMRDRAGQKIDTDLNCIKSVLGKKKIDKRSVDIRHASLDKSFDRQTVQTQNSQTRFRLNNE